VTDGDEQRTTGMRVRREVLGDAHVDRAIASTTDFTADFQDYITRTAWDDVWSRPGLDRQTRSAITLAMLAALGHEEELAMHVRAALRIGLTPAQIKEVLLQVAVYAGVPAANTAFRTAQPIVDAASASPNSVE
jgi:4-carboxymuconolactone decarboxylase